MTFKDYGETDRLTENLKDLLWAAQVFANYTQSYVSIMTPMFRCPNGDMCRIEIMPVLPAIKKPRKSKAKAKTE